MTQRKLTRSPGVSRRRFLATAARGWVALCAAPWVIPATALGRGGLRPPSERIQMGFIGLGGQGMGHLLGGAWTYVPGGYVARADVQVLAVCDVRRDRREHARQRCLQVYAEKLGQPNYRGVDAYADFRELLARPDIDAVLLALPYHWAAPMSVLAMRAGKDVYCEKPVAITIREGGLVLDTARQWGAVYQAGTQQRCEYSGRFRLACELVRNGRIGTLREVFAYRLPGAFWPQPWTTTEQQPVPEGFDWDLWLGPLPWRPYAGEPGHALPGCFVGDVNWSPHHYDIVLWGPGLTAEAIVEIEFVPPTGPGRQPAVRYHLPGGVVVHSDPHPGEPVGQEGGVCFVGTAGRIAVDRSQIVADPPDLLCTPLRPGETRLHSASSHSGNFLDCIRTRRAPVCNPVVAVQTMDFILAGGIALALQRSLRWNGSQRRFEGDAEANRFLSYVPRPPWGL
ncbi:MAG: Gfo/Idh/MocA family oxidoreductase [Limisphaera sp.]|nr:Gfo/Idh/MocA family oxidoreductase [Limisphaera sp.]